MVPRSTRHGRWPLIESFCARYAEPVTAAGFKATAKKWAAECARAQTRALPDNPYSVYYAPGRVNGDYDGVGEKVSFLATFPHPPFDCEDGWMSGLDWGEMGSRALDYGVNHFVWFMPFVMDDCAQVGIDDCLSMGALTTAIETINDQYVKNLSLYSNIACIGDWNMDGEITADDANMFASNWSYALVVADLNNDREFDAKDRDLFGLNMCMGGCAPITDPGCTQSTDCEVADWCDDGGVGIEDIFCFLEDWYNEVYEATHFDGASGGAAIFAYLSYWFAYGVGPCE